MTRCSDFDNVQLRLFIMFIFQPSWKLYLQPKGFFWRNRRGSTSPSASTRPREFVPGGTLGLKLLILGLRFGALEVHLTYFCGPGAGPWTCCSAFPEKFRKRCKKEAKKGAEMDAFPMIFLGFSENAKVRFDCASASGLRFRPLIFWLRTSIFAVRFLHCFFEVFGLPRGPQNHGSAREAGPP